MLFAAVLFPYKNRFENFDQYRFNLIHLHSYFFDVQLSIDC